MPVAARVKRSIGDDAKRGFSARRLTTNRRACRQTLQCRPTTAGRSRFRFRRGRNSPTNPDPLDSASWRKRPGRNVHAGTIARLLVDRYPGVALLAGYLLFAAAVVGGVSLIMLAFVYRLRKVKPPPGIVFFASVVGAAPLIVLLFSCLQGRG